MLMTFSKSYIPPLIRFQTWNYRQIGLRHISSFTIYSPLRLLLIRISFSSDRGQFLS
jgi:hypothetical protein